MGYGCRVDLTNLLLRDGLIEERARDRDHVSRMGLVESRSSGDSRKIVRERGGIRLDGEIGRSKVGTQSLEGWLFEVEGADCLSANAVESPIEQREDQGVFAWRDAVESSHRTTGTFGDLGHRHVGESAPQNPFFKDIEDLKLSGAERAFGLPRQPAFGRAHASEDAAQSGERASGGSIQARPSVK